MVTQDLVNEAIRSIDARTGCYTTDEQIEFASDFTKPMISFSNPGTGKTHSIVRGLILAHTIHRVRGQKINAMSFTKEATAELAIRYEKACKQCGLTPVVQFNTFHSICRQIINDRYPDMKTTKGKVTDDLLERLQNYLSFRGFETDDYFFIKKLYEAINLLNRSLIYDEENVKLNYAFRELNIDIDIFQGIRKDLFMYHLNAGTIPQGDLPNVALFVLGNNPDIKEKYLAKYEVMIVDEFQDMTKLYLTVLSNISKCLIVIGDIKQQIYGFNGASDDIVEEYFKMFPEAKRADLTQSFRCKNEIADFATSIYAPNDPNTIPFRGTGDGAEVLVLPSKDLEVQDIVQSIKEAVNKSREVNAIRSQAIMSKTYDSLPEEIKSHRDKEYMFLFRNNLSVSPIAEELYKQGVNFRVKTFYRVQDFPVFKELSLLAAVCQKPNDINAITEAIVLFPQFSKYKYQVCPVIEALKAEKAKRGQAVSIYDLQYSWDETSLRILEIMAKASARMERECLCATVFQILLPIYEDYIICHKWYLLEKDLEYYMGIVAPIVNNKTFPVMIDEENEKAKEIAKNVELQQGVKCYTMHSAKGLEADIVYILDVDEGVFPNIKQLKKRIAADCEYEAARMVREERNLLYVGATRAKEKLVITYRAEQVAELVSSPKENSYTYLDAVYSLSKRSFDDVGAFMKMLNLKSKLKSASSGSESVEEAAPDLDDI